MQLKQLTFYVSNFCSVYVFLTLIVQQHILRLQVSVDYPLLVEVLHALDDLCSIVTGPWLIKAWVVLIHVVDVIPGSKVIDLRQEGMLKTSCYLNMRKDKKTKEG